jgi:hypothetical protein
MENTLHCKFFSSHRSLYDAEYMRTFLNKQSADKTERAFLLHSPHQKYKHGESRCYVLLTKKDNIQCNLTLELIASADTLKLAKDFCSIWNKKTCIKEDEFNRKAYVLEDELKNKYYVTLSRTKFEKLKQQKQG